MRNKKLIILLCILFVVTLLVVLSSVLFTVQDVYGYCYNDDDETFDIEIAKFETNGLSRGKSIFFVNEEEVISAVESKYPDVNVINVERKFPNIIYINYVKIFPYLVFETEEDALLVSNDCKILSSQAKESEYDDYVLIKGVTAPSSTTVGEGLYGENTTDYKVVSQIMDVMERIEIYSKVVDMFEFIDLRKTDVNGLTYIKMRTGAIIEIQGGTKNVDKKLQLAVSLYVLNETKYMTGTIIVNETSEGQVRAYYDANGDRYEE